MMPQRHWLRRLQMSEARHDAGRMFFRPRHQRDLQSTQRRVRRKAGLAHPELEIGRHLIVAAARGVEATCRRADQFGQTAFAGHVDVFEVPVLGNAIGLILRSDLIEPRRNRCRILRRHDALLAQHGDMRL